MLTILEGADGTGKTTLAREAFKDHHYVHMGPPVAMGPQREDPWPAWRQYAYELAEYHGEKTVYDRFLYGERVYGPILRKDERLDTTHIRMLERVALSRQGVVVHCRIPEMENVEIWRTRQETEMIKEEGRLVLTRHKFQDVMEEAHLPVVMYDWTQDLPQHMWSKVEAVRPKANGGPGIGHWAPGTVDLLVGEQVNGNADQHGWPFVATSGSSVWLARLLEAERISERQLYWVNAADTNGRLTDASFIKNLQPRRIIALGHSAKAWCTLQAKVESIHVPHPQYWKRFEHNQRYPLLDILKEAP